MMRSIDERIPPYLGEMYENILRGKDDRFVNPYGPYGNISRFTKFMSIKHLDIDYLLAYQARMEAAYDKLHARYLKVLKKYEQYDVSYVLYRGNHGMDLHEIRKDGSISYGSMRARDCLPENIDTTDGDFIAFEMNRSRQLWTMIARCTAIIEILVEHNLTEANPKIWPDVVETHGLIFYVEYYDHVRRPKRDGHSIKSVTLQSRMRVPPLHLPCLPPSAEEVNNRDWNRS